MIKLSLVVLMTVGVAMGGALTGCAARDASPSGSPKVSTEIQTQSVTVGQTVRLMLVSNPTTGFTWSLDKAASTGLEHITITKEGFADSEPTDGMVGTPGRQWWIVRGDSPGEAVLQLRYLRPWEDDASPARRAAITVNVRQ